MDLWLVSKKMLGQRFVTKWKYFGFFLGKRLTKLLLLMYNSHNKVGIWQIYLKRH
jgi:hypothetical protein